MRLTYKVCKDWFNKDQARQVTKPIPNVKPLSPTDEKALIEFHNILIDKP